ncbi:MULTISPECIES: DUF934 domain-containing protein [Moraxella]|uniref:Uncharacterized protein n=1 Tax=Moraxella lacunata TaxID=477 RepID=A0A1B8PYH6_MORLA|nr:MULTISPECIES: DUF934 domain-containing protein [Moraxella]MBE9578644.1 DUF934 domain-containing protein [Moraxella sp. K1664]MBE9587897.1 DUF934 domain-containing protein [Moraxella sp. K1630]MBE9589522.1 DUF934 domain-containing protein [Moraxella sp. K127]MBE9596126.1 DUF934 domain-containing protein [Moraxella sp. K2450]MDH9218471.1 DUF934 domain-containing protein [Moraxella lacunata]
MKLIILKNDVISQEVSDVVLYATNMSDDEKTALSQSIDLTISDTLANKENTLITILAKDYQDSHLDYHILLTADDNEHELAQSLDINTLKNILIYVKDFKDGRVFSLIRQLRKINDHATIIVGGAFGLDQSSYFVKSGANGFIVDDDKVDTLILTLNDLKTAQSRQSVNALPMFR